MADRRGCPGTRRGVTLGSDPEVSRRAGGWCRRLLSWSTGAVIAALQIPAAEASPACQPTPAQLLASLSSDAKVPPLTGTVVETASLGLPQLPQQ